jgi:hypothetical protein
LFHIEAKQQKSEAKTNVKYAKRSEKIEVKRKQTKKLLDQEKI